MKKLVLAMLLTVTGHLLFDMYHSQCLAGSVQGSATVRLLSDLRNPVQGTLGLEQSGIRLSGSLGNNSLESGALDFLARSRDGIYVGAGVNVDREDNADLGTTVTTTESDTLLVDKKHDNGKHKGDKHHHKGKHGTTVTMTTTSLTTLSLGGVDLGIKPSLVLGVSARRGLFVESRILFGSGDVSNRTSIGLRW